jgi:predicted dehydrogenase
MTKENSNGATRVAIIGMGGFAARHHQVVLSLEQEREARLICTCDPRPETFIEKMEEWRFEGRGVRVFTDYRDMLEQCWEQLDAVIISTPIPLHAEMHRACVELGLPVYLEKPPTLDPEELEEMIQVDQRQVKRTSIPFNFIAEATRRELKERLLRGDFGRVERVTFCGVAPRATSYFDRAKWAGRLILDGQLVLDSCMGNAMAHKVHDALFWAGTGGVFSWGTPATVQAELYRAHKIEGADTVFCAAETDAGVQLRLFLTHASTGRGRNEERVICEKASLRYVSGSEAVIEWQDGRTETIPLEKEDLVREHHRWFYAYLRGERDRPFTMLEDSRPFVFLNSLVYVSAGAIGTVGGDSVDRIPADPQPGEFVRIKGLGEIAHRFLADGSLPSAQEVVWASPSKAKATPADLARLREAVCSMS